jgi:hypothetical protein
MILPKIIFDYFYTKGYFDYFTLHYSTLFHFKLFNVILPYVVFGYFKLFHYGQL